MVRVRAGLVFIVLLLGSSAVAQYRLIAGGSRSNYGRAALAGGGTPRSVSVELLSGGNLAIRSMGLGPGCVGHAMARPDFIVRYSDPGARLRFDVRANGGDTTLVLHTPDGRWLCDDDSGRGSNPRIELSDPPAGSYDIWVGSYRAGQNLRAVLSVSQPADGT